MDFPWPDTQSGEFSEEQTEAVREAMARTAPWIIETPRPEGIAEDHDAPAFLNVDLNTVVLTVRRCQLWAPWTGYPFDYQWKVAMDDHDHFIAGPAEITYTYSDGYMYG